MKTITYDKDNWKGESSKCEVSIPQFTVDQTLYEENYRSLSPERIRLEDQPQKVTQMVGRLMEKLIEKGIMNTQDLLDVLDSNKDIKINDN